jgi:hypothetical protein
MKKFQTLDPSILDLDIKSLTKEEVLRYLDEFSKEKKIYSILNFMDLLKSQLGSTFHKDPVFINELSEIVEKYNIEKITNYINSMEKTYDINYSQVLEIMKKRGVV